jgi:hypothetical protein
MKLLNLAGALVVSLSLFGQSPEFTNTGDLLERVRKGDISSCAGSRSDK